ncbi:MAG: M23 family metallopeptidase [bacterium]|nr:M23 family metallopeptidase [bacterium]
MRRSSSLLKLPNRAASGLRLAATALCLGLAAGCLSNGLLENYARAPESSRPLHPPLQLEPLVVTGTVGEFRNGNFHYGLDFSTGGDTGASVHAVDAGFVRQIMFGRYNIGYAVRVEHHDGRVSRYGHLSEFSRRILAHPDVAQVHDRILLRRDFVLQISDDSLPVRRGEVIGSSGETGIGFPHLHFEYINSDGRTWLNPLRHGLELPDRRPPVLRFLTIAPANADSRPGGRTEVLRIPLQAAGPPVWNPAPGRRRFEQSYVPTKALRARDLLVRGGVRFQLDAYDAAEPAGRARLGLAEGRLYFSDAPEQELFAFHFDRLQRLPSYRHGLLFDRTRTGLRGGARYLYNYYDRAPGALPFVSAAPLSVSPQTIGPSRSITLSGADAAGNVATVRLSLSSDAPADAGEPEAPATAPPATVFADRKATLASKAGDARLDFTAGQTFEDLNLRLRSMGKTRRLPRGLQALSPAFLFERVSASSGSRPRAGAATNMNSSYLDFLSPIKGSVAAIAPARAGVRPGQVGVYRLGRRSVYPLSLPDPLPLPPAKPTSAEQHTLFADGRYHFRTRSTGLFAVLVDRAAPEFQSVRRNAPGRIRKRPAKHRKFRGDLYRAPEMRLFLRIKDVGSGVDYKSLRVTVDGIDCYTDHDPDHKHVEVFWPAHIAKPGDHVLIARVRDRAGNAAKTWRYAYRVLKE